MFEETELHCRPLISFDLFGSSPVQNAVFCPLNKRTNATLSVFTCVSGEQ